MALQIRRGLQADLPSSPANGELLYATDTGNLYIGVSGSPQLISFGSGGGASAISDLSDVGSISGIANGQALVWNSSNSQFEYGSVAGSYGDSDVLTLLNGSVSNSIIPDANVTYDLGSANYRFRDLWLSGNTIQLGDITITSDGDGNVSFGNASVARGAGQSPFATGDDITTANTAMKAYVDAEITTLLGGANVNVNSLAEVANALANSNTELSTVAFTGNYSDLQNKPATMALSGNTYLTYDDANIDLTNVVGQAGATGAQGVSVSSAALNGAGNLILTLSDASTVDAGNVKGTDGTNGTNGTNGNAGVDGVSVSTADATSGNLILTLSDSNTIDAGNVVGPQGATGPQGDGNAGVSSATVNGSGNLVITLNDSTTVDAGNVRGEIGAQGTAGVGITSTSLVGGNLVLNYSNTSTQDVGNIQGPQGDQGATGATGTSISSASVTNGAITLTMSDATTINVTGNVQGSAGATGAQGNAGPQGNAGIDGTNVSSATVNGSGNLILTLSDASTIDAGNVKGADGAVDQTLSLVGNVITISGSNSNVDLTTALAVNTDAQTLSLSSNTLSISNGNSVDLSSFAGGGIASIGSNVISDLSDVSSASPTDGQALLWDNGNSVWSPGTVSSGGGASALDDLSDVSTTGVTSGQVLKYNGSSWAPAADNNSGGGGGGGASVERFKLNYATNGNLDSITDGTSGIASVSIDSATSGEVSITFTGYNYPPASIMLYGYDYANNKYYISHIETTMATREIAGGGSSGSPTLFAGSATPTVKLRLRETETGASRSFGTTTHAWIHIVMFD